MSASYENDVVAWASEQAGLLRSGKFTDLDIAHIADEIEDVGKSEQRDFARRMALLFATMLKWQHLPRAQMERYERMLNAQSAIIERRVKMTPSLRALILDVDWRKEIWGDAVIEALSDDGMSNAGIPDECPWVWDFDENINGHRDAS